MQPPTDNTDKAFVPHFIPSDYVIDDGDGDGDDMTPECIADKLSMELARSGSDEVLCQDCHANVATDLALSWVSREVHTHPPPTHPDEILFLCDHCSASAIRVSIPQMVADMRGEMSFRELVRYTTNHNPRPESEDGPAIKKRLGDLFNMFSPGIENLHEEVLREMLTIWLIAKYYDMNPAYLLFRILMSPPGEKPEPAEYRAPPKRRRVP